MLDDGIGPVWRKTARWAIVTLIGTATWIIGFGA